MKSELFYFLRLGLWKVDCPYTGQKLSVTDWKTLFSIAHSQAVAGIFIDGVSHSAMRPPREVWDQWVLYLLYLEQINEQLAACGKRWQNFLQHHGISSALFKGISVASWYSNPLHRSIGDIDLVITKGWTCLRDTLSSEGLSYRIESGDLVIADQSLTIELHPTWEFFYNPILNVRLQRMLKGKQALTNELYLICLIIHLRRHFLTYGVGLKQVADIAVMLEMAELDFSVVAKLLRYFHIERFSRYLFGFIYLNLKISINHSLGFVTSGMNYKLFQRVIWNDGLTLKFKQNKKSQASHSSSLRVLKNIIFWNIRGIQLLRLMPIEVLSFLLSRMKHRINSIFS